MTRALSSLRSRLDRWLIVVIILVAWGLRLCCLETVPPGWRDDELINIHALSIGEFFGELSAGRFLFYFVGASGHEPLYHYLLTGAHLVLGFNPLSAHVLSAALGTLTVPLTYVLARRLFGRAVAVAAPLALAVSFWSLMYSRTAIRHISLPPLALAAFYLLWRAVEKSRISNLKSQIQQFGLLGFVLGISLYTYPAARMLPVLLVLFSVYLALFHRTRFTRCWRGVLLALALAALVSVPLWIAIAQGRGEAAEQAQGIGADSRINELAVPLHELLVGNPRPLLENVWETLGMFHATGDPEWLYNIPGRPVFNLLGGILFWLGVGLCLYRWRQPRCFFLLLWLGLGLVPTFASIPSASLSHSILAQPVVYMLPMLPLAAAWEKVDKYASEQVDKYTSEQVDKYTSSKSLIRPFAHSPLFIVHCSLLTLFLITTSYRDLHDYFVSWPQQDMVRVLYRADYRDAARYLDAHPEIEDVAIASGLQGVWDRLALELDTQREGVSVRLFDPERALVWTGVDTATTVMLISWLPPAPTIAELMESDFSPMTISPDLTLHAIPNLQSPISNPLARFANGLELVEVRWIGETELLTVWRVAETLDVPPRPIAANPPPPGVYTGPRLAVFAHLLAGDGMHVTGDDGLWVDPHTLQPDDRFIQIHRFEIPGDAPSGPYTVRLGLYDPKTGERMDVLSGENGSTSDHILWFSGN